MEQIFLVYGGPEATSCGRLGSEAVTEWFNELVLLAQSLEFYYLALNRLLGF